MSLPSHPGDRFAEVLDVLQSEHRPMSLPELYERLDMARGAVRVYVRRAVRYGFATNPSRGVYESTGIKHVFTDDSPHRKAALNANP